jgi:hypothetical protein
VRPNLYLPGHRLKGLIDAIGFLPHILPGDFVSPCPATSADFSEFTPSTFSLIAIGIPKVLENFGLFPNLPETFFHDISTIQFQIAAGLNLAKMGNETEGDASQTSTGHGIQPMFSQDHLLSFSFRLLSQNAIIVRGTGGLELERDSINLFVKPVESFFIIES